MCSTLSRLSDRVFFRRVCQSASWKYVIGLHIIFGFTLNRKIGWYGDKVQEVYWSWERWRQITFSKIILNQNFHSCFWHQWKEKLQHEVKNFNCTEDGESSKESHGASDGTDLVSQWDTHIVDNLVIGGRVKVYVKDVQLLVLLLPNFKDTFDRNCTEIETYHSPPLWNQT